MTQESSGDSSLNGLARSLDELFRSSESDVEPVSGLEGAAEVGAPPAPDEPVPEDPDLGHGDVAWVAETGVDPESGARRVDPSAPRAGHDPLMRTLATYLRTEPHARSERVDDLRAAFEEARGRNAGRAMAEAVEALVLSGARDDSSLALARSVLTPAVAHVLATRFVEGVGEEAGGGALFGVVTVLGPEMAIAIGEQLDAADDRSVRRALVEVIVQMGDDASEVLERMVEDNRWFVVRNGVNVLGQIGDEASVQHLTTTLANEDARVRRETVSALTRIGGEDASMLVTSALEDSDPTVRAAAARSVGVLKVERTLRTLIQMLENESNEDVLVEVAKALGQLGDPSAVNALEKRAVGSFFSRPPTAVRVAAYQGLAGMATPRARQILEAALEDKDPEVRRVVRGALKDRPAS